MNPLKIHRFWPSKLWQKMIVSVGVLGCLCLLFYGVFVFLRFEYIGWQINRLNTTSGSVYQYQNEMDRLLRAEKLSKIGKPAVGPLIHALRYNQDPNIRIGAAETLSMIKDPRAVIPLIEALKDTDANVRTYAILALGDLKDPRAVEPLISFLNDEDRRTEEDATRALASIGSSAVEPLIAALKSTNANVQQNATWALGEIKDSRDIEPLIVVLNDPDCNNENHTAQDVVLRPPPPPPITFFKNQDRANELADSLTCPNRNDAAQALASIGSSAVEPLIASLKSTNASVRQNAVEALREINEFNSRRGEQSSEDMLIKALIQSGHKEMAEEFLNHFNAHSEGAAHERPIQPSAGK